MASSNKHWPSMFRSKPHQHQWQHETNSALLSSAVHRSPVVSGFEERTPEPKPRWNPKPEQIRILEQIFNNGMVNPPRDEIRKIRVKLQEYGTVGDANVFYWFQNRKSRSKHKQRHLQNAKAAAATAVGQQYNFSPSPPPPQQPPFAFSSSSSSSSEKLSPDDNNSMSAEHNFKGLLSLLSNNSQTPNEFFGGEPFYYLQSPNSATAAGFGTNQQGFYFPDEGVSNNGGSFDLSIGNSSAAAANSGLLATDFMGFNSPKRTEKMNLNPELGYDNYYGTTTTPHSLLPHASPTVPSTFHHFQDVGVDVGPAKATLVINNSAFEVEAGPFNVQEFGDDAMLIHSSGQPMITYEWGGTVHPLQPGGLYYLVRTPPY